MEVFIVFGEVDYQGDTAIAAFSQEDEAHQFVRNYVSQVQKDRQEGRRSMTSYDDYRVEEMLVDACVGVF